MKFDFLLKKALGAFLMTMVCVSFVKAGDPPVPTHSNWGTHRMGTYTNHNNEEIKCVELEEDNMLHISLYVSTATNVLDNQSPLYLYYGFVDVLLNDYVEITPSMLIFDINQGVYSAKIPIDIDLTSYCARNGYEEFSFMHSFTLYYQLMTPDENSIIGYSPYSLQNETLWPSSVFGILPAYDPLHVVSKNVCCYHGQPRNLVVTDDDNDNERYTTAESLNIDIPNEKSATSFGTRPTDSYQADLGLKIIPNPFNDMVTVQFEAEELGAVKLECLDAQGRVLNTTAVLVNYVGQQTSHLDMASIPGGVYYLRVSTASCVKMTKMVKISN